MKISSNMTASMVVNNMNKANKSASTAMKRLSSGLKVARSADDPASWAIANRLTAQTRGISQASQNSMDAISFVQTAEGALNEVHSIINRMRELTTQGLTGSINEDDRKKIQYELDELADQVKGIQETTEFNGIAMLNSKEDTSIQIGANAYQMMKIIGSEMNLDDVVHVLKEISFDKSVTAQDKVEIRMKDEYGEDVVFTKISGNDGLGNISVFKGDAEDKVDISRGDVKLNGNITLNADSKDKFQIKDAHGTVIGAREITGEGTVTVTDKFGRRTTYTGLITVDASNIIGNSSGTTSGEVKVKFEGKSSEMDLLSKLDKATEMVSNIRGRLGAYQNRLEHAVENLGVSEENMTESLSRVQDADMAEEMTEYTLRNVIAQSGISMLAQANQRPQQVLQLLNS